MREPVQIGDLDPEVQIKLAELLSDLDRDQLLKVHLAIVAMLNEHYGGIPLGVYCNDSVQMTVERAHR